MAEIKSDREGNWIGPQRRNPTPAENRRVLDLRAAGLDFGRIGEALGVSRPVALRWARELGLSTTDLRHRPVAASAVDPEPSERHEAGPEPLPAWHPIAAAVLAEARAPG